MPFSNLDKLLKKIIWLLFYILIFCYLLSNSFRYLDADLGWHLKVGQEITQNHTVPSFDLYDYTLSGKKWIDHEWLMNLISYTVYNNLGYFALNIFFAFLIIITLILNIFLLKKYYLKKSKDEELGVRTTCLIMSAQMLGVMAMAPHLGVRMQEISLVFLSFLLIILADFVHRKKISSLFFLLPLFYFWSSMHAGFLIGIFLVWLFFAYKFCQWLNDRFQIITSLSFPDPLPSKELAALGLFAFLSILSTLLTPYGLDLYLFLSEYSNTFYMKLIAEWLPAYYVPIQYKQLLYLAIAASGILLYVITIFNQWRRKEKPEIDLWLLGVSLLFLGLSFKSKRHFPLFFVSSFPLLILLGEKFLTYPSGFFDKLKHNRIIRFYLIAGMTLTSLNLLFITNFNHNPFDKKHYCDIFPCEASQFLHNNQDGKKLLNAYDWGGYLIWNNPEQKLFIDGRLPQYKFADHTLLEEYLDFFKAGRAEELLNKYQIQRVLYKKPVEPAVNKFEKTVLAITDKEKDQYSFQDYLKNSPEWEKVYEDEICLIYDKVE